MLYPGVNQTTEMDTDLSLNNKGYLQAIQRNTVKEMLMMNRQKWNYSQDDDNMVHKFKCAKFKTFPSEWSPHIFAPQVAVNQNIPTHLPPAFPESVQRQPAQENMAVTAEGRMSLFQWQIQTEAQRIGEASSEMLNMQDADGDTFLHIAVAQGRRALAYVLAAKMATCGSLDMKEHNGLTALQIATVTNQHLIVQDLLTHGAQVNTRDSWGRSPLYVSAEKGHFLSIKTIWRTLSWTGQPVDVEMCNYDGLTPLHAAVLSHNRVIKELRRQENPCSFIVQGLVKKKHTFVECINILLIMGASLATKDLKSGRTCLHMASEEANVELLQFILNQTMSLPIVNTKTFSGNTALHIVSSLQNHEGQVEAVKLLMRKGADPGIRNSENELPSQLVPEGPIGEKVRHILKGNMLMHK